MFQIKVKSAKMRPLCVENDVYPTTLHFFLAIQKK